MHNIREHYTEMQSEGHRDQTTHETPQNQDLIPHANPPAPTTTIDLVKPKEGGNMPIVPSPHYPQEEKIIPGYNFQSLFRKKSHIRLARKKHKEQSEKRSSHVKLESAEKEQKNIQKGHWTTQENKRYHWFLEIHSKHFILKYLRRTDKIFKNMASFISTREAEQCRSHHQKMEKKYHTFYQILLKLRMDFYSTASPEELKHDLEESGHKLKESTLITQEELKTGDLRRQGKHEQFQEDSLNNSCSDDASSKQPNNLLNENYENNLDFHIPY